MDATGGSNWDRQLHRRLIEGDESALGEAYDRLASLVFGLSQRVIGERRAAEDVTQEVFLHLWSRPHAFDPARGTLRAWLGTIAHRRAVDWVRRVSAERNRLSLPAVPEQRSVEEQAVATDTAARVRQALALLPVPQREAIALAYWDGCSYREVATLLGIPEGTAKSRIRLGLRRIAEALTAQGIG